MRETIQSVVRRLFRQRIGSIFIPLLALAGGISVISLLGFIPLVWSAVAIAVVPVIGAVIQFMQWFPFKSTKADLEMDRLIQLYKGIRYYTSFSDERTRNMRSVVKSMRGQAKLAKYTPQETRSFLLSDDEGNRMAGLSIVQWQWYDDEKHQGNNEYFDKLLKTKRYFASIAEILEEPRSPFEHFQAKVTMEGILPHLSEHSDLKQELCKHVNKHEWDITVSCVKKEWEPFKANVNRMYCGSNPSPNVSN